MTPIKTVHKNPQGVVKETYGGDDDLHLHIQFIEAGVDRSDRWKDLAHILYEQVYAQREDQELCSFEQWVDRIDYMVHASECYVVYISDKRTGELLSATMIHPTLSLHYGEVLSITATVNIGGFKSSKLLLAAYEYIGELNDIRHYMRYAYQSRGRYNLIYKELKHGRYF